MSRQKPPSRGGTGRWSARGKVSVVLELLRGADLESLSRRHRVTAATLSPWQEDFLASGEVRLKRRELAVGGRRSVEDRGPGLLRRLLDGEGELGDLGDAAQPRELGDQLKILGDEPLILALEEETDLAECLDIEFVRERHRAGAHLIITNDPR